MRKDVIITHFCIVMVVVVKELHISSEIFILYLLLCKQMTTLKVNLFY